jgi:hypothetical protein
MTRLDTALRNRLFVPFRCQNEVLLQPVTLTVTSDKVALALGVTTLCKPSNKT